MCLSAKLETQVFNGMAGEHAEDRITGYGIAYTGFGDMGFFKLEIKFDEQTKVITKCELQQ